MTPAVVGAGAVWEAIHGEGAGEEGGKPAGPAEEGVPQCADSCRVAAAGVRAGALACADAPGRLLDQRWHPVQPAHSGAMIVWGSLSMAALAASCVWHTLQGRPRKILAM